jgi:hypothetical protein
VVAPPVPREYPLQFTPIDITSSHQIAQLEHAIRERYMATQTLPLLVGHGTSHEREYNLIITCNTKRLKSARRTVERMVTTSTESRARHHNQKIVSYFGPAMCRRQQVHEVVMIGSAVVIDGTTYAACCQCVGFVALHDAVWIGNIFVCKACSTQAIRSTVLRERIIQCVMCKTTINRPIHAIEAINDVVITTKTFTTVYLCESCATTNPWAFQFPVIPTINTIRYGVNSKWRNLRRWNMFVPYTSDSGEVPSIPKSSSASRRNALLHTRRKRL